MALTIDDIGRSLSQFLKVFVIFGLFHVLRQAKGRLGCGYFGELRVGQLGEVFARHGDVDVVLAGRAVPPALQDEFGEGVTGAAPECNDLSFPVNGIVFGACTCPLNNLFFEIVDVFTNGIVPGSPEILIAISPLVNGLTSNSSSFRSLRNVAVFPKSVEKITGSHFSFLHISRYYGKPGVRGQQ